MSEFTQLGDAVMDIEDEDLHLRLTNTGARVYIDAKGWIDVATAQRILDWLAPKMPAERRETCPNCGEPWIHKTISAGRHKMNHCHKCSCMWPAPTNSCAPADNSDSAL